MFCSVTIVANGNFFWFGNSYFSIFFVDLGEVFKVSRGVLTGESFELLRLRCLIEDNELFFTIEDSLVWYFSPNALMELCDFFSITLLLQIASWSLTTGSISYLLGDINSRCLLTVGLDFSLLSRLLLISYLFVSRIFNVYWVFLRLFLSSLIATLYASLSALVLFFLIFG